MSRDRVVLVVRPQAPIEPAAAATAPPQWPDAPVRLLTPLAPLSHNLPTPLERRLTPPHRRLVRAHRLGVAPRQLTRGTLDQRCHARLARRLRHHPAPLLDLLEVLLLLALRAPHVLLRRELLHALALAHELAVLPLAHLRELALRLHQARARRVLHAHERQTLRLDAQSALRAPDLRQR